MASLYAPTEAKEINEAVKWDLDEAKAPNQSLATEIYKQERALIAELFEVRTDVIWHRVAIKPKNINHILFYVDRIEGDDLKDHGEEDHGVGWYDHIDKSQVNDHLKILDRAE